MDQDINIVTYTDRMQKLPDSHGVDAAASAEAVKLVVAAMHTAFQDGIDSTEEEYTP